MTASDKDLNPAIQKIGELATIDLYSWMADYAGLDYPYKDEEIDAIKDCWESLAEDNWKDDVFGN
jgi:hypothetical protein